MALQHDGSSKSDPVDVLPRGAEIGRYVVLNLVGRGGMGDVYAAYDPELDRKVAVKLLRSKPSTGQATSEGRTRLLREAQAIAKLSHPNVVTVYDVGTFNDAVFIAMEFIEGDTVRYWLNAGTHTWKDILRVFIAAGHGLAAAHDADIVHRDFKPDNVMVRRDGKVRVMDFGLARQTSVDDLAPPSLEAVELAALTSSARRRNPIAGLLTTATSAATAAPLASPPTAQAPAPDDLDETRVLPARDGNGDDGAPDGGAPALRQTAREMLDGSSLSPSALETSLTQTGAMLGTPAYMAPEQFASKAGDSRTDQFSFCVALYESLYGERPFEGKSFMALMTSVARGIVRDAPAGTKVPTWIRRILLRGLHPTASSRFPSMHALLHALEHDPSVIQRRWAVGAATAMAAGALIFGASRNLQARHGPCEAGATKLTGIWEAAPYLSARKAAVRDAFAATKKSYAERAFETARQTLDQYAQRWTATYTDACEATTVRGEQSPDVLDLRMSCLQGRLESLRALTDVFTHADGSTVEKASSAAEGLPDLDRCSNIAVLRAVVKPPEDPATRRKVDELKPRAARVAALTSAGHYAEARSLATPLLEDARRIGYLPVTAHALRANAEVTTGDFGQSERLAEQALWTAQAAGDDELVVDTAIYLSYLAAMQQADPGKGRVWLRFAESTLNRLGGHDLLRSWLLNNRGLLDEAEGRFAEAVEAQRQAAALKEKVLGREHPDVATSLGNWASALAKLKRLPEALEVSARAVRISEKALGTNHPDGIFLRVRHAGLLDDAGRYAEAEPLARAGLQVFIRELGAQDPLVVWCSAILGRSLVERGLHHDARPLLERALAIEAHNPREVTMHAEVAFLLARVLWADRGDHQRALTLAFEAKNTYASGTDKDALSGVQRWLSEHDAL